MNNKIHICENLGFCGGVRNAVWNCVISIEKDKRVVVFGDLIHNDRVLLELKMNGVEIVKDIDLITPKTRVIIPAHGTTKENLLKIHQKTEDIIDMTCPMVINMKKNLINLANKCDLVILIGRKNHTEIVGAVSFANKERILLVESLEELKNSTDFFNLLKHKHTKKIIGLISQTTASSSIFFEIQSWLEQDANVKLKVFNTLCPTVIDRQNNANKLANESDGIAVVGDRRSSNTYSLYEIAKKVNPNSYLVTSNHPIQIDENSKTILEHCSSISILAGTSSPYYVLDETVESLTKLLSAKNKTHPVIVVYGPTAVGKSSFAEKLAESINGEIVNYDSMQVYKHLSIGTAKPNLLETNVPMHLFDYLSPKERVTVASYQKRALETIHEIHSRSSTPILVGGSYLYISSLIDGLFEMESGNNTKEVRKILFEETDKKGLPHMYNKLLSVDIESAKRIHSNDKKRILRALEVFEITGEPISKLQRTKTKKPAFFSIKFGLLRKPETIYSRIHQRTDLMIKNGLLNEVKWLVENNFSDSINEIKAHGYRELIKHVKGEISLEDALLEMEQNTRHYAKRQLSWLRQRSDFHLINLDASTKEKTIDTANEMINIALKHSSI
ncbi:MAG: tRNA (adenosine(37)-N6)-dimethylallyltransferase MiaA [Caldisericia bacterium]|nr:tRNA (adenosine(37)-N6)-dimethylallyltransferase MiaA [Caldisericia bacterium]